MLSRFHTIPACHGQTDGQTDGQNCYINIARQQQCAVVDKSFQPITLLSGRATQRHMYDIRTKCHLKSDPFETSNK